jgi:hypothetical protein
MATEHTVPPPTEYGASESPERSREAGSSRQQPSAPAPPPPPSREADADVVLDVPQLAVDELDLELHAPILEQVKLQAKGLQVEVFAKLDLGNVTAIAGKRPVRRRLPDVEGRESAGGEEHSDKQRREGDGERRTVERQEGVRGELEHVLESAKQAYDELSDRDVEQQIRDVYETARQAYTRVTGRPDDGGGGQRREGASGEEPAGRREGGDDERGESASGKEPTGRRALDIAKQGGKAAGLTAAGLAGGAALEAARHSGMRFQLPVQRRSSAPKAVMDKVMDRLG